MIDVDSFKKYNSAYGNIEDDEVLLKAVKLIEKAFIEDLVFRYGGEELSVISKIRGKIDILFNKGVLMYIDIHNHLDFYKENINEAIKDINENKILTIASSIDIESYTKNKEYSKKSQYIIPTFGVHPSCVANIKCDLCELIPYIKESKLIGEIGLDFLWVEDRKLDSLQREIYYFLLKESAKLNKYIVIHTKNAEEEIYNSLKNIKYNKAIIHWYSGPLNILEKLIDLGCYFSISVDVGYSKLTEEIVKKIPIDKLLVETDGPTALEWVNGEYGYPSEIKRVVKDIAFFKKLKEEDIINVIYKNYSNIIKNVQ